MALGPAELEDLRQKRCGEPGNMLLQTQLPQAAAQVNHTASRQAAARSVVTHRAVIAHEGDPVPWVAGAGAEPALLQTHRSSAAGWLAPALLPQE